jgi:hypothetical protein
MLVAAWFRAARFSPPQVGCAVPAPGGLILLDPVRLCLSTLFVSAAPDDLDPVLIGISRRLF